MRASHLIAVALFGAALLAGELRGTSPLVAQPRSHNKGCPSSFHEVHPTISGKDALQTRVPPAFKIYPSDVERNRMGSQGSKFRQDVTPKLSCHKRATLCWRISHEDP